MNLRRRWLIPLLLLVSTLALSGAPTITQAQTSSRCFAETGFCIEGRIREFWEQNGGLAVFGFPIGPQQMETIEGKSYVAQRFQRNRLELHPETARPYDVQLGRLGDQSLKQQGRDWQTFPKSGPQDGCRFFPETGHNICGDILKAWRANGLEIDGRKGKSEQENIALFGLPISDQQSETIEGRPYIVQHFERARFELHPENQPPYNVLLGLLGTETNAPPPPPADPCADVRDPIDARIRPGKCVKQGEQVAIDIYGFKRNERVGFWLTTPEGSIYGTVKTYDIGPDGAVNNAVVFPTGDLYPGIWYWVFEGTSSKHQSVIYFKVLKP